MDYLHSTSAPVSTLDKSVEKSESFSWIMYACLTCFTTRFGPILFSCKSRAVLSLLYFLVISQLVVSFHLSGKTRHLYLQFLVIIFLHFCHTFYIQRDRHRFIKLGSLDHFISSFIYKQCYTLQLTYTLFRYNYCVWVKDPWYNLLSDTPLLSLV